MRLRAEREGPGAVDGLLDHVATVTLPLVTQPYALPMDAPTNITADRAAGRFEVTWPEGRVDRLAFRMLRCECPCAVCVSELTGERLLDPESVPKTIHPIAVELSGNYALKIRWSDHHDTGLYTWNHLRRLGETANG